MSKVPCGALASVCVSSMQLHEAASAVISAGCSKLRQNALLEYVACWQWHLRCLI